MAAGMAASHTIRWDRVGRVALLVRARASSLCLYIGPARSYSRTWQEATRQAAEVARAASARTRASARRRASCAGPRSLEREARRLGMVRPGERAYVVRGLPRD